MLSAAEVRTPRCPHVVPGRNVLLVDAIGQLSLTPRATLAELGCSDIHLMARVLGRAEYVARADRALFGVEEPALRTQTPDRLAWSRVDAAVALTAALFGFAFLVGLLL